MALSTTGRNPGWHLWARFAGLTGLLILAAGLVVLAEGAELLGAILAICGGTLAGLAVLFEIRGGVRLIASQRAALGSNVALQIALAIVLLVGVNLFSFWHHVRFDWTSDRQFTIPAAVREQMAQLRGETTIVVCQRHTSFGQLADKQDNYDAAAERRIVEKVKDLAEQFQDLGPRFRVEVLDSQEEDFEDRLRALKKEAPELGEAVARAPENSIFFHADGKVQRLGFHDIYQLDKQASQEANGGRGNLVLRYQGVEPFARKVLNIDQKKPRIAFGVIHELLGLEGSEELGMAGTRKALAARGFDGRDIILKKWSESAPPEPAVLTFDESKYERLEEQLTDLDESLKDMEKEAKQFKEWVGDWETRPLKELTKTSVAKQLRLDEVDEQDRQLVLARILRPNLLMREMMLKQGRQEREGVLRERSGLNVENLSEQRRISDLEAKLKRMLADCDLLVIPRLTLFNVARGDRIPNSVYRLDDSQVRAIKDFMKTGKPVLFCLGPSNDPPGRPDMEAGNDPLEGLLRDLGVEMPKQTILFNVESKSFSERRSGLLIQGSQVEVPPVEFDWSAGAGAVGALSSRTRDLPPNPIRVSLRLMERSVGKGQPLDLRLRHPRPVYYKPGQSKQEAADPVFMMTSAESWNESQPFPTRERVPRFELPRPDDPDSGTVAEKRRGPFPIGIAVEKRLPASWYEGKDASPASVRLAVIGHGGVFMGEKLTPAKEKLLLDVSNWLLGRDDLLARDGQTWEYPRVELSESANNLWQWGTRLGLPLLCAYAGLVVLMVRRMR